MAVWRVDKRKEALPVFLRGLQSKVLEVRLQAIQGLCLLGEAAKPAVPELLTAYRDRDRLMRRTAYGALQQLDPDTAATLANPDQD
jgi:HEAT repeat protein